MHFHDRNESSIIVRAPAIMMTIVAIIKRDDDGRKLRYFRRDFRRQRRPATRNAMRHSAIIGRVIRAKDLINENTRDRSLPRGHARRTGFN